MLMSVRKFLVVIFRFIFHINSFTYFGAKIVVPNGLDWRSRWQIYSGKYELPEITALQILGKPQESFLEIGGGAGIISAIIAETLTPSRHEIYEALDENVSRINQQNFRLSPNIFHSAVVSNDFHSPTIKFFKKKRVFGSGILRAGSGQADELGQTVEVPALRVSNIDIEKFNVILVDVEGAEDLLLPEILPRLRGHLIFEFHPNKCALTLGELIPASYFKKMQYVSGSTFIISVEHD